MRLTLELAIQVKQIGLPNVEGIIVQLGHYTDFSYIVGVSGLYYLRTSLQDCKQGVKKYL